MAFRGEQRALGLGYRVVIWLECVIPLLIDSHHFIASLCVSPAFAYGLICLGMAYISSHLGSVLQVMPLGEEALSRNGGICLN